MPDFAFYSTDINPTTDPANADPAPATLVVIDQPPLFGECDLQAGDIGRGSILQTFGGIVVQDFGVIDGDDRIAFSDEDVLSATDVANIKALWETVDGEYYFTDGYDVWKVRFARPNGFRARRNLLLAAHGVDAYSYEINLVVIESDLMSAMTTTTTTTSTTTTTTTAP